jgi:hypothetical protein
MLDLYDLIRNIEKRPAMYWEKIIRFFSPDETASLQQFFVLFNEFTESQTAKSFSA